MFYWARVITSGFLLTFASSWCFVKVLKAEPGRQRLLQAIPMFLIYVFVPFLFCHETEMLSLAGVAYLSFRLPAIKALAICLNRGPLTPSTGVGEFLAVLSLPVLPSYACPNIVAAKSAAAHSRPGQSITWIMISDTLASWAAFGGLVLAWWLYPCQLLLHMVMFSAMICLMRTMMDCLAAVGACMAKGISLAPHFDAPFTASSLSDFWRRWNIVQSQTLKFVVYDVIIEGRWVRPASLDWSSLPAPQLSHGAPVVSAPVIAPSKSVVALPDYFQTTLEEAAAAQRMSGGKALSKDDSSDAVAEAESAANSLQDVAKESAVVARTSIGSLAASDQTSTGSGSIQAASTQNPTCKLIPWVTDSAHDGNHAGGVSALSSLTPVTRQGSASAENTLRTYNSSSSSDLSLMYVYNAICSETRTAPATVTKDAECAPVVTVGACVDPTATAAASPPPGSDQEIETTAAASEAAAAAAGHTAPAATSTYRKISAVAVPAAAASAAGSVLVASAAAATTAATATLPSAAVIVSAAVVAATVASAVTAVALLAVAPSVADPAEGTVVAEAAAPAEFVSGTVSAATMPTSGRSLEGEHQAALLADTCTPPAAPTSLISNNSWVVLQPSKSDPRMTDPPSLSTTPAASASATHETAAQQWEQQQKQERQSTLVGPTTVVGQTLAASGWWSTLKDTSDAVSNTQEPLFAEAAEAAATTATTEMKAAATAADTTAAAATTTAAAATTTAATDDAFTTLIGLSETEGLRRRVAKTSAELKTTSVSNGARKSVADDVTEKFTAAGRAGTFTSGNFTDEVTAAGKTIVAVGEKVDGVQTQPMPRHVPLHDLAAASMLGRNSTVAGTTHRRPRVSDGRKLVALLATFIWSGIEHEIFHWYLIRKVSGLWLLFFSMHGLLVGLEQALDRTIRRRRQKQQQFSSSVGAAKENISSSLESHADDRRRDILLMLKTALRWLITFAILETTAALFFFPVLLDPEMVGAMKISLETPLPAPGSLA